MEPSPADTPSDGATVANTSVKKTPVIVKPTRIRGKRKEIEGDEPSKRRCVSTACIACRKRKSKCDGNLPACAACSSVYYTQCVYDPNSDHRRKGVYRKDEKLKTRNTTLEILIQALLNASEAEVPELVKEIRTCESLDAVAEALLIREAEAKEDTEEEPIVDDSNAAEQAHTFEKQISTKMGELMLEGGSARYIGGTSNLLFLSDEREFSPSSSEISTDQYILEGDEDAVLSWTEATDDPELILHLLQMYFTWHYTYFTTLSKSLFYRDFYKGRSASFNSWKTEYCTPLLVNAMLALGCHFTAWPAARDDRDDSSTAGNHFFKECKRLIMVDDEFEKPKLATVQALALMSVREAGCGREAKGWVYSGMSFRMACDLGLNLDSGALVGAKESGIDDEEMDARRITFWGCFLFDKCWSNYLGRMPQLPKSIITVPKFEVFPSEDAEIWTAYTDSGPNPAHAQPSRTRAVALQISKLCEISNDLMTYFYNPIEHDKSKAKQIELKKLSDIHGRLEEWKRDLPIELEPREGGLPSMLVMHMFFQLLYIHLFRPFLKYSQDTSPLPPNVSPRRLCTNAAATISKLLRLYRRSHGLRQICNICVYIAHSACTIHMLNLPDKNAKRDITHGVKHLEEIAESWLCARRAFAIFSVLSRQWNVELPEEAEAVLVRTDNKFAAWNQDIQSRYQHGSTPAASPSAASTASGVGRTGGRASPMTPSVRHVSQHTSANTFHVGGHTVVATAAAAAPTVPSPVVRTRNTGPNFDPSPEPMPQPAAQTAAESVGMMHMSPLPVIPGASSTAPAARQAQTAHHPPRAAGSPESMFGGVDQLLRHTPGGDDWWINDQKQLATGFSQWPTEFDVAPWGVTTQASASPVPAQQALQHQHNINVLPHQRGNRSVPPGSTGVMTDEAMLTGVYGNNVGQGHGGMANDGNGFYFPGGMEYPDESEWYQ